MASGTMQKKTDFLIQMVTVTHSGSDVRGIDTVTCPTVTGYTPIGVVGHHENSDIRTYLFNAYVEQNLLYVGWKTVDGSSIANHTCDIYVLYKSA